MFLAVGTLELPDKMELPKTSDEEKRQKDALRGFLSDPQLANSYSYARNNPITNKDPNGNCGGACLLSVIFAGVLLSTDTAHAPVDADAELSTPMIGTGINVAGFLVPGGASKSIIGKSFGKLGTVIKNTPGKVTGFTTHGVDQAITRGVGPSTLLDTVKNPRAVLEQAGGNRLFLSNNAGVVLNKNGEVVTTYTSNSFKPEVKEVLKQVSGSD